MDELEPRVNPFYPKELRDIFKDQEAIIREKMNDKRDKKNDRLAILAIVIAFASLIVAIIALLR